MDWEEAIRRLDEHGYQRVKRELEERELRRESLDDEIRERCNASYRRLRELLDGLEDWRATC